MIRGQQYILTLLVLFVLYTNQLPGQRTQPYFHNFTTEDGLPSSETYCAVQDKDGYMWIGTDNGVARFDGYEFEVFGSEHGLTDAVVFNIVEDANGRLWFSTFSGQVFYFNNGRFFPYYNNKKLVEFRQHANSFNLIDVLADSSLILFLPAKSLVRFSANGDFLQLIDESKYQGQIYTNGEIQSGVTWGNYQKFQEIGKPFNLYEFTNGKHKLINSIDLEVFLSLHPRKQKTSPSSNRIAHRQDINESIITVSNNICLINKKKQIFVEQAPISSEIRSQINHIVRHHKKGFWLAYGRSGGLIHCYLDNDKLILDQCKRGLSINQIGYDKRGGLWLCSAHNGLFYSINPDITSYEYNNKKGLVPLTIQTLSKESFLVSFDDVSLVEFNFIKQKRTAYNNISPGNYNVDYMVHDSSNNSTYFNEYFLDHGNNKITLWSDIFTSIHKNQYQFNYFKPQSLFNKSLISFSARNIAGTFNFENETPDLKIEWNSTEFELSSFGIDYKKRKLLGTINGLFQIINKDSVNRILEHIPALNSRVSSIDNLLLGGTLIGTRGSGLVYLNASKTTIIDKPTGLLSSQILGIHQTPNGTVWINSLNGLNKLRLDANGSIQELRSFTNKHGLASNEINYIASYENNLWLATGAGVVNFVEPKIDSNSTSPLIRSFSIDGVVSTDSFNISPGQHDLKITYNTINYQMLGDIPYRYRINPNEAWQYTTNRTVEYPNLNPGNYQFEVQSQNQDLFWSESTFVNFTIPLRWFQTWWAKTLLLAIITGGIAGLFYLREKRRREEFHMIAQIDALERSAIQAQMNPHFVFNSLNSIQHFILESNTKQAVYYLARFASLIRKTLRASVDGVHSLKEEVEMLTIYLALEKLRFKDSFDYQITIDSNISPEEIHLAPMLVQPFVENAIIHGVVDMDAGGMISVHFAGSNQEIQVTVKDNGKGFDTDQIDTSKSLGVNITRKRLNKNLNNKQLDGLRIEPRQNQEGKPAGTLVHLRIKPVKKQQK